VAFFATLRGLHGLGRAAELAERFSADLDRSVGHLSRGNRQKIGLIQTLFHAPELLILDEPTGGLDPLMQEQFHEVVAEERKRGTTVFLSSHDLDEVERLCDRVAIIRDGRLIGVEWRISRCAAWPHRSPARRSTAIWTRSSQRPSCAARSSRARSRRPRSPSHRCCSSPAG